MLYLFDHNTINKRAKLALIRLSELKGVTVRIVCALVIQFKSA